jgi:monolysocardiolipin acyltransferase
MDQAVKLISGPSSTEGPMQPIYSTNGKDSFQSPSIYARNRHAWIHVFPEACCHQSPDAHLRYFKWGVSRLILESDPAPDFIPMFVHGTQDVMAEDRGFPRWAPRIGNRIRFEIGQPTNVDRVFGTQRAAWKRLVEKGDPELLRTGPEATELRIEVAKGVREEISRLRERMGLPAEEDETAALAETWSKEPNKRRFKSPVDGGLVNRH